MLDKPVIVMNYGNDDLSDRYERRGVVAVVRNERELRSAVQKYLYDEKALRQLADGRRRHFDHFAGSFDGQNTRRVTERILHALKA